MANFLFDIGYGHFLVLAAVLFAIGMAGVLVRRNALIILMSIELMLNAANLTLPRVLALSHRAAHAHADAAGARSRCSSSSAVAAAEAAVGLAIVDRGVPQPHLHQRRRVRSPDDPKRH